MLNAECHLLQGSLCINAGMNQWDWMTNAVDLAGRTRVDRASRCVDMGCFEYLPRITIMTIY